MKLMSQMKKLFLLMIVLASANIFAGVNTDVAGFNVSGLDMFVGKHVSVYYVSARPATLQTPGQIAKVRKVLKGPLSFKINSNGMISVPDVSVPRDGWTNFNHVIFVVHAQAKHALRNVDGTYPEILDVENAVPVKTENAQYLYRKSVEYSPSTFAGTLKLF
tara:strand:+ start:157 stop:642 length:486 start_codon:yes stop_codon:yes gene_type:complete